MYTGFDQLFAFLRRSDSSPRLASIRLRDSAHLLHPQDQLVYLSSLFRVPAPISDWYGPRNIRSVPHPFTSSIDEQDLWLERRVV